MGGGEMMETYTHFYDVLKGRGGQGGGEVRDSTIDGQTTQDDS